MSRKVDVPDLYNCYLMTRTQLYAEKDEKKQRLLLQTMGNIVRQATQIFRRNLQDRRRFEMGIQILRDDANFIKAVLANSRDPYDAIDVFLSRVLPLFDKLSFY